MRKTTLALFVLLTVCTFAQQRSLLHCDVPKGVSSQVLVREGYVTSYNKDTRLPNWVAWRLTKERMGARMRELPRSPFREDDEVENPVYPYEYRIPAIIVDTCARSRTASGARRRQERRS